MKKLILLSLFVILLLEFSNGEDNVSLGQYYINMAQKYTYNDHDSLDYYAQKLRILCQNLRPLNERANYLYQLGDVYLASTQLDSAEKYFSNSLEIREKIEDYTGIASIKNKFGYIAWMQSDIYRAKDLYQESISLHRIHGNKKELAKALNNLANLYTRWGDYTKSINLFMEALENYQEAGFVEGVAWLNFSIAILYKRVGEYQKSLRYSKEALKMYTDVSLAAEDSIGIRMCYNQLGFIYTHHLDSLEKGLKYQLETLRLAQKVNVSVVTADALSGVGQTYYKMGKFDLAKDYIQRAYTIRMESGNLSGTASNLKFLGYIEAENNNYPMAIAYYDSAMVKAIELNHKNIINDLYLAYSKLYEKQKKYEKSLKYYHKFIALKDSIASSEIASKIASTELKYEVDRKTRENEILSSQNELQKLTIEHSNTIRNFLIASVVAAVLMLIVVIFLYVKQRQIKTLKGLIPICANCKKIRNDKGMYEQIEHYISEHSDADFSHGICPDCMKKLHPEVYELMDKENYFQK